MSDRVRAQGKPKRVADDVRELIVSGRFAEGDLLGTEAELLQRFKISRPSLREALKILEAEGLISIMRGVQGGVIVHRPDDRMTARAAALLLQARSVALADVVSASAIIEPAAARMVAMARAHRRAARQLGSLISEQRDVVSDSLLFPRAQQRFHEEIIVLAGNQTLIMVQGMLTEIIVRASADVAEHSQHQTVTARKRTIRAHERLVAHIAEGSGSAAQEHWSSHLAKVRHTLLVADAAKVIELSDHR